MLSLNRAFSAPIKLASNLTDNDLLFLMAHDGDSFNRWEAGQTIARKLIMEAMPALAEGAPLPDPSRFAAALGASLDDRELEPAFVALLLSPPGEGDIAGEIGRDVDTDLVHRAREWLRSKLSETTTTEAVDAAGNQWFTLPGKTKRAVLIGGHIDSVPNGGWLDGALNLRRVPRF